MYFLKKFGQFFLLEISRKAFFRISSRRLYGKKFAGNVHQGLTMKKI